MIGGYNIFKPAGLDVIPCSDRRFTKSNRLLLRTNRSTEKRFDKFLPIEHLQIVNSLSHADILDGYLEFV